MALSGAVDLRLRENALEAFANGVDTAGPPRCYRSHSTPHHHRIALPSLAHVQSRQFLSRSARPTFCRVLEWHSG
jgi:hypothetical protein